LSKFIRIVKTIRKETDIPLVLMTYSNLLYHRGYDKFLTAIKNAGIDGLILPDMAIDEAREFLSAAKKHGLDTIFLISPNTSPDRIKKIANASSGFLYLVSVFGTTGVQRKFESYTLHAIKQAKNIVRGKIPLAVGFGVSNQEQAKSMIQNGADAIIVGSAFLRIIEKTPHAKIESKVRSFTSDLKKATVYNKK
jgi:tryptophan synthase alpha chain